MDSKYKKVCLNLEKREIVQMRMSGYTWPQLMRAGYNALMKPSPLIDRMREVEERAKLAEDRSKRFGDRLNRMLLEQAEKEAAK